MIKKELFSFFLTKNQTFKLRILNILRVRHSVTAEEICLQLDMKLSRLVKSLINDIKEEFNSYSRNEMMKLKYEKNLLFFDDEFDDNEYIYVYRLIIISYMKSSAKYSFLLYMLEFRNSTVNKISEDLVYSTSYCYLLIKEMSEFLEVVDINVYLDRRMKDVRLTGDEFSIRLLHYYFTITVFNSIEWPFKTISKAKIEGIQKFIYDKSYLSLSKNNRKKYDLIMGVWDCGLTKGKKLENLDKHLSEIFEYIFIDSKYYSYFSNNFNEVSCMVAFISHVIPETVKKKERIAVGKKLLELTNNPIIILSKKLVDYINTIVELTEKDYEVLVYETTLRYIMIKYFCLHNFWSKTDRNFKTPVQKKLIKKIEEIYCMQLNTNQLAFIKDHLVQVCSSYIFLFSKNYRPLNIYTEFAFKSSYKVIIENTLERIYNKEKLVFIEDGKSADIIISDMVPEQEVLRNRFIYFSDIDNVNDWERLGELIQRKLLWKLIDY